MGTSQPYGGTTDGKDHQKGKERRPVPGHSVSENGGRGLQFFSGPVHGDGAAGNGEALGVSYDTLERTGASSATISRVNRSLAFGHGGYQVFFERQKQAEEQE